MSDADEVQFGVRTPHPVEMGFGMDLYSATPPGSVPQSVAEFDLNLEPGSVLSISRPPALDLSPRRMSGRRSSAGTEQLSGRSVQSDMSEGTLQMIEAERINTEK